MADITLPCPDLPLAAYALEKRQITTTDFRGGC